MRFELTIELGNDGMQTSNDLGRALRQVVDRILKSEYILSVETHGGEITRGIKDINGNTVGSWTLKEDKYNSEDGEQLDDSDPFTP